jgi:REP element-mobilizing transposase RayT
MASTLTNLLFHVVFSTKLRAPLIDDEMREPLYRYISGIVRNQRGTLLEIGGMPDHLHILARLSASKSLSDVIRAVKSDSSRWVNERNPNHRFAWQLGYGAFSVSQSQARKVQLYIQTQEDHHRGKSFKAELLSLFEMNGLEYDEGRIWS